MGQPFVRTRQAWIYPFDLDRRVPVAGARDRAGVGSKADQGGVSAEAFTTELTKAQLLAPPAHLGLRRIANV